MRLHKHPYRIRNVFRRWNPMRILPNHRDHYPQTLRELFETSTERFARRRFSRFVDGGQAYSYAKFRTTCDLQSQRLSRFGIKAGDKVAILSQNMPNWTVAFFTATAFVTAFLKIFFRSLVAALLWQIIKRDLSSTYLPSYG